MTPRPFLGRTVTASDGRTGRATAERHIHRQPTGGAPHGPGHPGSLDEPGTGPELELELDQVVERIARLVLHANTLAERMVAIPGGTAQVHNARDERVQRLRAAVTFGQRAIQAAVWHGLDPTWG